MDGKKCNFFHLWFRQSYTDILFLWKHHDSSSIFWLDYVCWVLLVETFRIGLSPVLSLQVCLVSSMSFLSSALNGQFATLMHYNKDVDFLSFVFPNTSVSEGIWWIWLIFCHSCASTLYNHFHTEVSTHICTFLAGKPSRNRQSISYVSPPWLLQSHMT